MQSKSALAMLLEILLPKKRTITEEEVKKVTEQLNADADLESENLLIIYNEDGTEMTDRVPLPAKFNKFIDDHTITELVELINYCDGIISQRPILVYVDKDEKPHLAANLKTLGWPDTGRNLSVNITSELPSNCGLILLYKNGVEVHVY